MRREVNDFGDAIRGNLYKQQWQEMTPDFNAVSPINAIAKIKAPLMLIHGGLSDLLSVQGVQDMVARRPDIDLVTVPDQGHAPLLSDKPTMDRIIAFCKRCDGVSG